VDRVPLGAVVALAAVLLAGTLGLARLPSRVPIGDDIVPDPVDVPSAWGLTAHGDAVAEAQADGTVLLRAHGSDARATAWTTPVAHHPTSVWDARVRLRAPGRGRKVQLVVAAPGEPPLWFGSYRIDADGWGWVTVPVTARLDDVPVRVGVIAVGEGAHAVVSHVDLVPMQRRWGWVAGLIGLVVGWLVVGGAVARRLGLVASGAVAVVVAGVLTPRPWVDRVLGPFQQVELAGVPVAYWAQKLVGHAGMFGLIGYVVSRRVGPRAAVITTVALAVVTEASQLLAVARSASMGDVGLDLAGALLGIGLATVSRRRRSVPESPG